jgi:hypothetical protein
MSDNPVDFNFQQPVREFMHDVQKTIVQQDDYRGIGGHGPEEHHGSFHRQTDIGIGTNTTVNFRDILPKP